MKRYFFEAMSTADLNNCQAWIIRLPHACRLLTFQLASGIVDKVLVDALNVRFWSQLNHNQIPGRVFLEPLSLSFLCAPNEDVELRIHQLAPIVLEDCDLVFTEGRHARALGWVDVEEGPQ